MNVTIARAADIVLSYMSEDQRRRVWPWIDYLKRWDTDTIAREHSKKLDLPGDAYMMVTTADVMIFFDVVDGGITVLDLASKDTIMRFRKALEAGER